MTTVLVLGATGYVGSRLVPALLDEGYDVVAASSSAPDPERFAWGHRVVWRRCDVTDAAAVGRAVDDVDAVCYLVHSLDERDFTARDRVGAEHVRDAVTAAGVGRLVYLSGLIPALAPGERQSAHLASRLEVEQILSEAGCPTLTLRAGVVLGAGSTSYEVIRQLASLLLVQPIPRWLDTRVQPVAVTDVVRALVEGLAGNATGSLDVGGPDVVPYPRLLGAYARAARLPRLRVPALVAPVTAVGVGTALLVGAPFWTVTALVESLQHDMVCRPGHTWEPDGEPLLGVGEAMARAVGRRGPEVAEAPLPSDPAWTRMRAPLLDRLHAPTVLRAGASLARRRVTGLLNRP
ncbi:NAD-dependent epimerase/dehydratase family protein [Nocardioides cynanchi]|uniref:NAD-dependent epimerase/dehydratase family protein n=1 Tax=Nocardioides cynanchi TaxID=2558918 RepID=UPI001781DA3E|nr:NAD-dependent epimerase/dehydratase family protein [Nocardioides cynanchi]